MDSITERKSINEDLWGRFLPTSDDTWRRNITHSMFRNVASAGKKCPPRSVITFLRKGAVNVTSVTSAMTNTWKMRDRARNGSMRGPSNTWRESKRPTKEGRPSNCSPGSVPEEADQAGLLVE